MLEEERYHYLKILTQTYQKYSILKDEKRNRKDVNNLA